MVGNKYAVALVGYGGMGHWHARLLKEFDEIFLYGIYDINPEKLEAAKADGYVAYSSFAELCADEKVDVVLVATPNDYHKEYIIGAMRAGKAAISEKPVTLSSADLQDMIDVSRETGKLFTVHQNRRWDGDFRVIKKIYDEGMLGDIHRIESRVHGSRGIPGDWRGQKVHGGGMVLDWGVHILDQMLLLVPEKIKSIYAHMHHITNYEVDDGFEIVLYFESGKTALLEVGTSNFINLPRWYMLGENGTAQVDNFHAEGKIVNITNWDNRDAVPIVTAAGLTKTMAPRTKETIKEQPLPVVESDIHDYYKNIVAVLKGEEEQIVRHDQLMRVMRVMEAAFEADRLGQIVPFED
ncbi:MAG: Gfo/Idh/MocA family oxidoreductase [Clostridia bacterium]|nr:Gfo/Idh/MocA family oxidoreductase [Clostridia bacterium]